MRLLLCLALIMPWFPTISLSNSLNFNEWNDKRAQPTHGQTLTIDHKYNYPFNPSSIITILIFQEKGASYIALGEKRCAWYFAKEIENTIKRSIILPSYFKEKLLQKIQNSKLRQEAI
jgi:hypothetical protein